MYFTSKVNKTYYLVPYWVLNFTIGFGWFSLQPIVPQLVSQFSVGPSLIVELISIYGYAMVAFALLSGYLSARYSVSMSLVLAAFISTIGLFLRAVSTNYDFLIVAQIVAAVAYPLAVGPVGSIAQSFNPARGHTLVGVSVGILFLGIASGSFLTPYVYSALGTIQNVFFFDAALSVIALVSVPLVVRHYPRDYAGRSLKGVFKAGMLKNWYIGLVISSFSVMFGAIAAIELTNNNFTAGSVPAYAGLLSGLSFLGSALGAIILPPVFEAIHRVRAGMVITAGVALLSVVLLSYYLSYTVSINIMMVSFFLFGFAGNAFWSMAMTSTTRYVKDPAQAGFSTSMYSVATNLGVAFVPVFFGSYFTGNALPGVIIVSVAVGIGFVLAFFLKVAHDGAMAGTHAEGAQGT